MIILEVDSTQTSGCFAKGIICYTKTEMQPQLRYSNPYITIYKEIESVTCYV
jgi:hypothetical protein